MNPANGGWVIFLSLLIAMLLSIVHLPQAWPTWLGWLRPDWLLLVLFFWVVELPHRVGLISIWILGLFVDVLLAEPLGLNGLILSSVTYLSWRFYERLRMYSVLQQCVVLLFFGLGAQLLRGFVLSFERNYVWDPVVFMSPLMTLLVWPFLFLVLLRIRTGLRVE